MERVRRVGFLAHHEKNGRRFRHEMAMVVGARSAATSLSTKAFTSAVVTTAGSGSIPTSVAHLQNREKASRYIPAVALERLRRRRLRAKSSHQFSSVSGKSPAVVTVCRVIGRPVLGL